VLHVQPILGMVVGCTLFISKMAERIAYLRDLHKGKTGVVRKVAALENKRWVNCAGLKVVELEDNGRLFTVHLQRHSASSDDASYKIAVVNKHCDCGEWQDHFVPCIHAIAYFRLHEQVSLEHLFTEQVDPHYTYENERCLLRQNIVPVCIERICLDGNTLPPWASTKRSTGRLKKQ
jgi:hypothetical protein